MKKKLSLLLSAAIIAAATTACTGNISNPPPDAAQTTPATNALPAADPAFDAPPTDVPFVDESSFPSKPFEDLNMFEVDHITVEYGIHNYRLLDEQCGKLINLLREIVIYDKVTERPDGVSVICKIAYKGNLGKEVKVELADTQLYINYRGYKCEYEACDAAADYIYDIYLYQFHN